MIKKIGLGGSPNDHSFNYLRHTFAIYRSQYGTMDLWILAKIMDCSVRLIKQHYDSARVENMIDYITQNVEREDAFSDVILIFI